eukprot:6229_1
MEGSMTDVWSHESGHFDRSWYDRRGNLTSNIKSTDNSQNNPNVGDNRPKSIIELSKKVENITKLFGKPLGNAFCLFYNALTCTKKGSCRKKHGCCICGLNKKHPMKSCAKVKASTQAMAFLKQIK